MTAPLPPPTPDTEHTIALVIEVPVFGPLGGRPDASSAARVLQLVRQSVHPAVAGHRARQVAPGVWVADAPIDSYESIIGKD